MSTSKSENENGNENGKESGKERVVKHILFVDDDTEFLSLVPQWFEQMSNEQWKVFTASTHGRALEILRNERVELIVLDIGMPVMDGMQFLRLMRQAHPGRQVVMLTGQATEERRKECLELGAAVVLEKPATSEGYQPLFATLDSIGNTHSQPGFHGATRQVGLQEVLRMKCLGRKSLVVEVFTPTTRGTIHISEGAILHAETGGLQGEAALYGLLGLAGAEFNLRAYAEPRRRTIRSHWEFLLMEAARMQHEHSRAEKRGIGPLQQNTTLYSSLPPVGEAGFPLSSTGLDPSQVRIAELLLCSGAGEMLFESQCESPEGRLQLLAEIEQQATQVSGVLPTGCFDRLEMTLADGRAVIQIVPDRRLLVRSLHPGTEGA